MVDFYWSTCRVTFKIATYIALGHKCIIISLTAFFSVAAGVRQFVVCLRVDSRNSLPCTLLRFSSIFNVLVVANHCDKLLLSAGAAAEIRQMRQQAREKVWLAPADGELIRFLLPDGQHLQGRFSPSGDTDVLYHFVFSNSTLNHFQLVLEGGNEMVPKGVSVRAALGRRVRALIVRLVNGKL